MYIPRGPILDWTNYSYGKNVLDDIIVFARKNKAIFLKIMTIKIKITSAKLKK
jgi:hypothetical protein